MEDWEINSNPETWTLLQCQNYLAKYPKAMNANVVRKRMEQLSSQTSRPEEFKQKEEMREVLYLDSDSSFVKHEQPSKTDTKFVKGEKSQTVFAIKVIVTSILVAAIIASFIYSWFFDKSGWTVDKILLSMGDIIVTWVIVQIWD